jgi:hypothetical protein
LNITSYASGTNPWKKDEKNFGSQSFSDGKFEVIGFEKTTDLVSLTLINILDTCIEIGSYFILINKALLATRH